jgi:quercetin dioxygenase-like cupin family protein
MANLRLDFLKTNALDAVAQLRFANNAFHGPNHSGFNFEMHETILGAGTRTHAPHKHEHEEIIVVFAGTVETYLEGRTEIAETGSVIYFASNQMHSARNAGTVPCRYYVIELRGA